MKVDPYPPDAAVSFALVAETVRLSTGLLSRLVKGDSFRERDAQRV